MAFLIPVLTLDSFAQMDGLIMGPEEQQRVSQGDYSGLWRYLVFFVLAIPLTISWMLWKKRTKKIRQANHDFVEKLNEAYASDGSKIKSAKTSKPDKDKSRIQPTRQTITSLLKNSGNRCNLHPCANCIDCYGHVSGHIFSIVSNEKEQIHYDPGLSDHSRVQFDNLMVLCDDHFFDVQIKEKYSIEDLIASKKETIESANRDMNMQTSDKIIDELIQRYIKQYPSQ